MSDYFFHILFGIVMGLTLSLGGLSDFEQIHKLFVFQNFPLLGVFAATIGLNMLGFFIFFRHRNIVRKTYNGGTIPGSVMFGVGWAMTGACPSIALVQLGEGKLGAVLTIFGIFTGVWIYRAIAAPNFRLDTGICGE